MTQPSIVIWGAGNIGRGFLADLFSHAGYRIVFVDSSPELIEQLKNRGKYTVVRNLSNGTREDVTIRDFRAHTPHETAALGEEIERCNLLALAVYPGAFEQASADLMPYLLARDEKRSGAPLDVLICTNLMHAGNHLRLALEKTGVQIWKSRLEDRIGLVETLVIRIAPQAPVEERKKDPLLVWTNGYPTLHAEKKAFRGATPALDFLRLVEDMRAEEMRKLYTYNMAHAVLAYHGALRGYSLITECLEDEKVRWECETALEEIRLALQTAYGYSEEEMRAWNRELLHDMDNPALGDTVRRDAADPFRKLSRNDRLIGAALFAAQQGVPAPALLRASGAAFLYQETDDAGVMAVQDKIRTHGLRGAIKKVCSLEKETSVIDAIEDAVLRLPLEIKWEAVARQAYEEGFQAEKRYHGCGQCVLFVLMNILGKFEPAVFNAATGLSGGLGLFGGATCSSLTGGVMAVSMLYPRSVEEFDGARENKYATFAITQRLIERYTERYGGILCHDIHTHRMGRPFDLRSKDERVAFDKAGAHDDECTDTVGLAARWTVELLAEKWIEEEVVRLKSGASLVE